MPDNRHYINLNRNRWDELVDHHLNSSWYDLNSVKAGKSILNELERGLLNNLDGKRVLHLQCHFGLDTISLYQEGAKEVVGVDFSEKAIKVATELAEEIEANVRFVQSDVLQVDKIIEEKFDIVFTSYGTIVWLPDLIRWGQVISNLLKKDGKFVFVDTHPFAHIFEDMEVDKLEVKHSYFTSDTVQHFEVDGSYATSADIRHRDEYLWTHSFEEILNSLINAGLRIKAIEEYPTINWKIFPFLVEEENGWYIFPEDHNVEVPLLLSIIAEK